MDKYYAKQMLEFNEEAKKYLKLEADWILKLEDVCELGTQVRKKMLQKIEDRDADSERIKRQSGL